MNDLGLGLGLIFVDPESNGEDGELEVVPVSHDTLKFAMSDKMYLMRLEQVKFFHEMLTALLRTHDSK